MTRAYRLAAIRAECAAAGRITSWAFRYYIEQGARRQVSYAAFLVAARAGLALHRPEATP